MANTARTQSQAAARQVSANLAAASHAGIHNPHHSWWSDAVGFVEGVAGDVVHFAEHNWQYAFPEAALAVDAGKWLEYNWVEVLKVTSAVLGGIATVAGFLALMPGVGAIALPVALIASLGATADDAVLAATGNGQWSTVILDGVGDLGFGAGEMLSRTAEGVDEAERLAGDADKLEKAGSALQEEIALYREAASSWDSVGDSQVFQVGRNGETVVTKATDMAAQERSDAAPIEEQIVDRQDKLTSVRQELADLPGKGGRNGFRYSLRTFDFRTDGNAFSKALKFVKNPSAYADQILHPPAAKGEQAVTGFRQVFSKALEEQLHGPATNLYRINAGVGAAGTGLGSYIDKRAWTDVLGGSSHGG